MVTLICVNQIDASSNTGKYDTFSCLKCEEMCEVLPRMKGDTSICFRFINPWKAVHCRS